MSTLRPLAALLVVPFVALACSAEIPPEEADPGAEGDESGESAEALTGAQACSLVAGASAGLAVVASQAFVGTTTCAGALAVTGAGELVCVVPAGATALTAIAAVLTGSASYLLCSASTSGSRRIPLASTGSSTCSTVSATTSPRFCSNLYRRYKNACGSLDLRTPNASETSCASVSLATARDQSTCTTLQTRIERNAQCLHGRRIMQDFIRRGICQPDPTDPSGTNHEPPMIKKIRPTLAPSPRKRAEEDPEEDPTRRRSDRRWRQVRESARRPGPGHPEMWPGHHLRGTKPSNFSHFVLAHKVKWAGACRTLVASSRAPPTSSRAGPPAATSS